MFNRVWSPFNYTIPPIRQTRPKVYAGKCIHKVGRYLFVSWYDIIWNRWSSAWISWISWLTIFWALGNLSGCSLTKLEELQIKYRPADFAWIEYMEKLSYEQLVLVNGLWFFAPVPRQKHFGAWFFLVFTGRISKTPIILCVYVNYLVALDWLDIVAVRLELIKPLPMGYKSPQWSHIWYVCKVNLQSHRS